MKLGRKGEITRNKKHNCTGACPVWDVAWITLSGFLVSEAFLEFLDVFFRINLTQ